MDAANPPLAGRRPAIPEGLRIYAVGDVHGRLDLLREIEAQIDSDAGSATGKRVIQVMLGDYIDRGPDSYGVIAHLIERRRERELVTLRGNHEDYTLGIRHAPDLVLRWCRFGGVETLASYGIDVAEFDEVEEDLACRQIVQRFFATQPADHAAFIAKAPLTWRCGDYLFVHAGIRPGIPLSKQSEQDMLWIRHEFLDSDEDFGFVVVHGHTPTTAPVIRPNRIGIDTRAYETGQLTCLVLEGANRRLLTTG